jgi:hypothetical protein
MSLLMRPSSFMDSVVSRHNADSYWKDAPEKKPPESASLKSSMKPLIREWPYPNRLGKGSP